MLVGGNVKFLLEKLKGRHNIERILNKSTVRARVGGSVCVCLAPDKVKWQLL